MGVTIQIPTPLRRFTAELGEVQVEGATVAEALGDLTRRYPGLQPHLYTEDGHLRSFVNVFLNDDDVRHLQRGSTRVAAGDTLTIIPSIAGGRPPMPPMPPMRAAPAVPAAAAQAAPQSTASAEPAGELPELTPAEIRQYSRHLIMPEVGIEGQRRLKAAKVLLIGAGGLGSPLGLYLAAAGVGTLGLVDFDVVDETNLHRQVLFSHADLGKPKLAGAVARLAGINPYIRLVPHELRLDSSNALSVMAPYDIVVDGTDNFQTRYLVNDACVLAGKPNVYGSIFRFEGQVSVFWGARGPCYRCLFPEPPPPGLVPSCAEGGVLGVLPGVIGALQANEVIKLIVGAGEPLIGRLLLFDALKMRFRELKLRKDPACPICSDHPTQTELIDYDQFCGIAPPAPHDGGAQTAHAAPASQGGDDGFNVAPADLQRWLEEGREVTVLDVRSPQEHAICRIEGAQLIPLQELPQRLGELDPEGSYVVHCHHGPRSTSAVELMQRMGYAGARNLAGGIDAWSAEVDPTVPRY
ncbi:MAG TPA: molybdopterin-synthase adenylyltransferase MoeB [Thermoanaerobaculia bacterium]|nr:molybdopterin-synthase adenylyltransferase MoeB [Thermoanaerobaculia bacterium]